MKNDEDRGASALFSDFDIQISFVIRHLSFVIYQPYFASR